MVCAIIRDAQGRVLLARRPAHKHLGGKWEFPGGKVEALEAPAAAILREIREELGCDIANLHPLPSFIHDYDTVVIQMLPFCCELASGSPPPRPHEHSAIAWATLAELSNYDLAPADLPIVAQLSRG